MVHQGHRVAPLSLLVAQRPIAIAISEGFKLVQPAALMLRKFGAALAGPWGAVGILQDHLHHILPRCSAIKRWARPGRDNSCTATTSTLARAPL